MTIGEFEHVPCILYHKTACLMAIHVHGKLMHNLFKVSVPAPRFYFYIKYYVLITKTCTLKVYCLPMYVQVLDKARNNVRNLKESTCNMFKR